MMVTTVDQLLMIAFNGNKRWSVIMGEVKVNKFLHMWGS